jgi:hypothetical protein
VCTHAERQFLNLFEPVNCSPKAARASLGHINADALVLLVRAQDGLNNGTRVAVGEDLVGQRRPSLATPTTQSSRMKSTAVLAIFSRNWGAVTEQNERPCAIRLLLYELKSCPSAYAIYVLSYLSTAVRGHETLPQLTAGTDTKGWLGVDEGAARVSELHSKTRDGRRCLSGGEHTQCTYRLTPP